MVKDGAVKTHLVEVKTGDKKGAGTDANVFVIFRDEDGMSSPEIKLDIKFHDEMERGQADTYENIPSCQNFGVIEKIELWRDDKGFFSDWFCEMVMLKDLGNQECYRFPVHRWVKANKKYVILRDDTSLPQYDPNPEQRQMELLTKRGLYEYTQLKPGYPVQIAQLPEDEQFSTNSKGNIALTKTKCDAMKELIRMDMKKFSELKDLDQLYTFDKTFPVPKSVYFKLSDEWLGAQRLAGCNPCVIKLCTQVPENLAITDGMLDPFLEGMKLQDVINSQRLFITDYKIINDIPLENGDELCAPIALWFVNGQEKLIPVAIQLKQNPHSENPVFLPSDPPVTWRIVKMRLNHADAALHQTIKHLGCTHLIMEGVCVAFHRHLAANHPIFRLLAPHFLFLLATNTHGLKVIMSECGYTHSQAAEDGAAELIKRGVAEWRLDVQGCLPKDLESRGLLDEKVLPIYPYRDDGLLVYSAIERYVKKIVSHYYDEPHKLYADIELQSWISDLAKPYAKGGVGLKGVPNEGQFRTIDEVIQVLTSLIFTCSAQHAAVNFGQYEAYGYPPNYPAILHGKAPQDKTFKTEADLVVSLPSVDLTTNIMALTKILSTRSNNALGDWEMRYQYDVPAVQAEEQFRNELKQVSETIKSRNAERCPEYFYDYLDPAKIPNSISI